MCLCVKLTRGQLYWLVLCVNLTQAGVIREISLAWGNSRDPTVGHLFQLVIKREGLLWIGTIPGLVFLGYIRKQAEQARGSNPVRNIPPWPLHQLLLPDLLEFQS